MPESKLNEVWDELRTVLTGRNKILDSILPPLIFVLVNPAVGFQPAVWSAVVVAGVFTVYRLARHQPMVYALGGLAGVGLAGLAAFLLNRAEGFFLPNILTGGLTALVCLVSAALRHPMVAWTSFLARRWPWEWYWHPRVRPAYTEVTLVWAVYFGLRLTAQLAFYGAQGAERLGFLNILTGWPATLVLLVVSYIYGTWRLRNLGGPSVEEFKTGAPPPWQGQRRGF